MKEIQIELALVAAKAPLAALADVILRWEGGQIKIRRCAVFHKPGEPPWVSFPSLPLHKNGSKSYLPLVELPRELKEQVFDAVLSEYGKHANQS